MALHVEERRGVRGVACRQLRGFTEKIVCRVVYQKFGFSPKQLIEVPEGHSDGRDGGGQPAEDLAGVDLSDEMFCKQS